MHLLPVFSIASCLHTLCTFVNASPTTSHLPRVDLGYQVHEASAYNVTGDYYTFSNIRFAAPPTGYRRFRAPTAPKMNRTGIVDGSRVKGIMCPQANPSWLTNLIWLGEYLTGQNITLTQGDIDVLNNSLTLSAATTGALSFTEDCLFLDVVAPKKIFDKAGKGSGSAVMVWIHGGGFTTGAKSSGNPAGLLARSMTHGRRGIIYVTINYRLGAFGWLAGPTIASDGIANAGLYDQRFALEWVQRNIHLFGGDPSRVTVFGESGGGGSIMHHITAFGGRTKTPFARAVPQSPAFAPQVSDSVLEFQLSELMAIANVSTFGELRRLPSQNLIAANTYQVWRSTFGSFTYSPAVDGTFVPALPGVLLAQGKFDTTVKLMTGHNSNEGLLFTPPLIRSEAEVKAFIALTLPTANGSTINYIAETLYPPVFDGSYGYADQISRTALYISEVFVTCNNFYMNQAVGGKGYAYLFAISPGLHAQDVPYTYFNGDNYGYPVNATAAIALQDYLTTFAESGVPKAVDVDGLPRFVRYGANATVQAIGDSSITHATDPAFNARCAWLQQALYV